MLEAAEAAFDRVPALVVGGIESYLSPPAARTAALAMPLLAVGFWDDSVSYRCDDLAGGDAVTLPGGFSELPDAGEGAGETFVVGNRG